jgi:acetolactate synthase-1/2/3 large subunit
MPTCADVLAATLREAGITRMFGLPGGEVLHVMDAARRAGLTFLLTRHEAAAAFMADVTGQITRRPGVAVSTLGPGALNLTLGVANAFLDRSPLVAITATMAAATSPIATHQNLDLNAVFRPFTKLTMTLDGTDTAARVRHAIAVSRAPRMGPVHLAVPSDVARVEEQVRGDYQPAPPPGPPGPAPAEALARVASEIARARRPVLVVGLDVDPVADVGAVRAFVDRLGVPVFTTPKAKGIVPEDHPAFFGVCAGVSGDAVVLDAFADADLLVGLGFDPVESDKTWHATMKLVNVGPVSIAAGQYRPHAEAVGEIGASLEAIARHALGPYDWSRDARSRFRSALDAVLSPAAAPRGLSGCELTRRLRACCPRDTILTTDVGSVKMVTTQAWEAFAPLAFFESNGLSAMSYGLPAAMAARLAFPDRPIVCTMGDGGFGMTMAEIETCVRERLPFVTVVYNDSSLSLIDVAQARRGYPTVGVRYGRVDFAVAAEAMGAWAQRVDTLDDFEAAVREGLAVNRPAVIDALVDPAEYTAHTAPGRSRQVERADSGKGQS